MDDMANENGSAAGADISEEIRKAKEVARSLAGKEVSSLFCFAIFCYDYYQLYFLRVFKICQLCLLLGSTMLKASCKMINK